MIDRVKASDEILLAALEHVAFDGWEMSVLSRAESDCGYDAGTALRLFPGGVIDLIAYFCAYADRKMVEAVEATDLTGLGISARIRLVVLTRLEQNAPYREAVRRALSVLALPLHSARAAELTWGTVDAMWHVIGDKSPDFSFYTKRMTLAAVYSATILCWINDDTPGFADTKAFLDRRLQGIGRFGKNKAMLQKKLEKIPTPWDLLARLQSLAK